MKEYLGLSVNSMGWDQMNSGNLFYTNIVLTPAKDTGIKDKVNTYVKTHNDIIKNFYVIGYDEICAMLDNNRDVATSYAAHILAGDILMNVLEEQKQEGTEWLKRYLFREFEEENDGELDWDENYMMKYKHLMVAELSKKDCHMYIQKLFEIMEEQTERREDYIRIMKEVLEDEITCRLMKTPLQITIIAILVKNGGKPPHERYSLFRQYCDTIIRREKQKEIVATLNDNTGWLEEIHYIIGDRLQCESEKAGNPSAEISKENLNTAIRAYVEENQDYFYESESGIAKKWKNF